MTQFFWLFRNCDHPLHLWSDSYDHMSAKEDMSEKAKLKSATYLNVFCHPKLIQPAHVPTQTIPTSPKSKNTIQTLKLKNRNATKTAG